MSVVAYVRVSSASQNVKTQRDAIAQAAKARGDRIAAWYEETFTGSTMARPELARLRADATAGKVRKLYVYRLDRLTRTGIRDTLDVVESFTRVGCAVVTIADGFELQGPTGEILLAVVAWAAKVERLAIGERISAARARVEGTGGKWGRPPRMTPELAAKARRLAHNGASVRAIAVSLKVPRSTVARALSRKPPAKAPTEAPRKQASGRG